VVLIPLNSIDSEVVVLICLSILVGEGFVTKVDIAFFGTNEEQVVVLFVEVEAHTTGEPVVEGLFLGVEHLLLLVDHKLKFQNLFSLELVLHQAPVGNTAIR